MTDNQKRFADEYLIDGNATRAYKAAYPSVKKDNTAAAAASRLLKNVNVAAYVKEQIDKISSSKTADAQEVLEFLTSVMRGEGETEENAEYPDERPVIRKPETRDRLKAAELIGKRYGLFKESVSIGVEPVVIENDLKE